MDRKNCGFQELWFLGIVGSLVALIFSKANAGLTKDASAGLISKSPTAKEHLFEG